MPVKALATAFTGWSYRLKHWVEEKANHAHSRWWLAFISFIESSFFPIPPDFLMIPLAVIQPKKSYMFAVIATVFSVLGGVAGYFIGFWAYDLIGIYIMDFIGWISGKPGDVMLETARTYFLEYGVWAVIIAGFTPIPYKVFTIAAGFFGMALPAFILASAIGRAGRFFLVATFIYFIGPKIKSFIDNYFDKILLAGTILLILGFVALKLL